MTAAAQGRASPPLKPPAGNLLTLTLAEGVTMQLAPVPAGTFTMGSPPTEEGRQPKRRPGPSGDDHPPFHMGIYEVTQRSSKRSWGRIPASSRSPRSRWK